MMQLHWREIVLIFQDFSLTLCYKVFIALLEHGLSTGERATATERGEEGGQPLETVFIDEE